MFASFFFSLLAGLLVIHVEPLLKTLLGKYDRYEMKLGAGEIHILTFCLLMLCAAVATWSVGGDSSAFLAVSGGVLGYFGADLYAFLRDPDKTQGESEDDWDGELAPPGERRSVAAHDGLSADPDSGSDADTLRAVQDAVQVDGTPEVDEPPEKETKR